MKWARYAAAVVSAGVLMGGAARATTIDFAYDLMGAPQATGSFTYATGANGVIGYADLTAFEVTVAGVTYDLADVTSMTDAQQFAFDTASMTFEAAGHRVTLQAENHNETFGFFFSTIRSGEFVEDSTQTMGSFDSIDYSVASVPEPATWFLMLAGFAGLGAVLRRYQRASSLSSGVQPIWLG